MTRWLICLSIVALAAIVLLIIVRRGSPLNLLSVIAVCAVAGLAIVVTIAQSAIIAPLC